MGWRYSSLATRGGRIVQGGNVAHQFIVLCTSTNECADSFFFVVFLFFFSAFFMYNQSRRMVVVVIDSGTVIICTS
jgi:hypothetical protein